MTAIVAIAGPDREVYSQGTPETDTVIRADVGDGTIENDYSVLASNIYSQDWLICRLV